MNTVRSDLLHSIVVLAAFSGSFYSWKVNLYVCIKSFADSNSLIYRMVPILRPAIFHQLQPASSSLLKEKGRIRTE